MADEKHKNHRDDETLAEVKKEMSRPRITASVRNAPKIHAPASLLRYHSARLGRFRGVHHGDDRFGW
jgi:hypothetical protein